MRNKAKFANGNVKIAIPHSFYSSVVLGLCRGVVGEMSPNLRNIGISGIRHFI